MKTILLLSLVVLGTGSVAWAQAPATNKLSASVSERVAAAQRVFEFQSRTVDKLFHVSFTGVLPKLRRAENPLQLINPLAPASYGNGYDNVVINPRTGEMEGIAAFAIKF
jgi:hypothetical protein